MRSRWKWRAAAVLLLALIASRVAAVFAVTLNKCCDIGLALQHPDASCKTDIYDDDWIPFVYASNPQGGFSHTTIPKNSNIVAGSRPVCRDGKLPTLIHSPPEAPAFVLLDNELLSLLMLHGSEESPPIFAPDEFCVDRQSALVCGAASQQGIRKCCGPSAAYSETNGSCVHGEKYDSFVINAVASASGFPICHNGPSGFYIVAGNIEGNLTAVVDQSTGELQLAPPPTAPLETEEYCIERVVERPLNMISVFVCAPPLPERTPIRPEDHSNDIRFTLYPAGLAISAFFLAATLATGCLLPKAHHALHWRCQTCHVACLLVGDVLLATVQLAGAALPPEACKIMAVMMHFFFLSAFFWLNAMCFNIWWTFRDLRPMSADPGQERFRYRAYSVYSWGGPLMIAGLAVLLDNLPGLYDDVTGGLLRPRFGERRCWFYGDLEIFTFFHGPVGVLLLLNLVLFTATTRELTCGLWRREGVKSAGGGGASSQASSERSTLGRVCLKLVIVMGVTWIADVVSWAVGGPAYVWFVTDMVNALQGVLIFIVVGCQPQVWAAVKRLWWCSRGSSPAQGSTAANPMSSSSQGAPSTMAVEPSSPAPQSQEPPVETIC